MREIGTGDGRLLAVSEGGDPAGMPIVVCHGTPGSRLVIDAHVLEAEQTGIRLIGYDRPGYGGSTRREGRVVADCAEDVVAICGALGIDRCCVWGISGGGPHALALAAQLPDLVAAAAALAPVGPYEAEGLDFFEGMGEQNIEEFKIAIRGGPEHEAASERDRRQLLATKPDELVDDWHTLLGPADRAVATGAFAAALLEEIRVGIEPSGDGWLDDDVMFTRPWGFEFDAIRIPVLLWQGEQDRFVPRGHGAWLAGRIPGVDARFTAEDGHLTLFAHRVPEVHAWLRERFD
jgi:pimeloyl-ACP methyl ester carboxylesterase